MKKNLMKIVVQWHHGKFKNTWATDKGVEKKFDFDGYQTPERLTCQGVSNLPGDWLTGLSNPVEITATRRY